MPGTSLQITPSRTVTDGAALTFETLVEGPGPLRINPEEATLLRVISGIVSLSVGGDERLLGIGDEAIVRAGQPHRIASLAGQARVVMGFRSAAL